MPIIIASANVQNLGVHLSDGSDLSRKDVVKCGQSVRAMGVTVAGFQEVVEDADKVDIAKGLGPNYELLPGPHGASELALGYDTREVALVEGSLQEWLLMSGVAGLEPNRYYLQAQFTRIGRPRLAPFAVGTTHTISKAFSAGQVSDRARRVERWTAQWERIGKHQRDTLKDGVTVFGTGDLNRTHDLPDINSRMRVLANHGLDWVWMLAGGEVDFDFMAQKRKKNPSDHDVVGVQGGLVNLAA